MGVGRGDINPTL